MTNKITSSMEDYLEAISIASADKGYARVKDIKALMNVKMPSVTGAIKQLAKEELVAYEKYGYIELTEKGKKLADSVKKKHVIIHAFLEGVLKVKPETAEEDACKIEHVLSAETFDKLSKFVAKHVKKTDFNKITNAACKRPHR
ncbi:DtxR family transcriptional regulator [Parelusimicrobium proximum]|uniref:metal-dependent transcriptional regulator n=1 Tax=Parelusimicrobium proximum TaxID=3228953 RepID=UPI003D174D74